jgi:methylated-DNA-[protein]-cysteine S-methyltransferase
VVRYSFYQAWNGIGVVVESDFGVLEVSYPKATPEEAFRSLKEGIRETPVEVNRNPATVQLEEYFAGKRREFDLKLDLRSLTDLQQAVLYECAQIPYGEISSYGELARRIDRPNAPRAVGQALGRNPIPIIIPCHRVLASDGTLHGFGGGLELKRRLLEFEAETVRE